MATSADLSPKDVVNALQTLTDDQTKELFFHLGVQLHVLDDIKSRQDGNLRKIYTVQTWFDNDLEASWEKIVAGLEQIGMNALSQRVASQHNVWFPTANLTSLPTNPPSLTQPPVPTESAPIGPVKALNLVPSNTHPSTSTSVRVRRVKMIIEQLQDSFTSVVFKSRSALCKKEAQDPEFVDFFRDYLLFLPLSKKATHVKFFRDSEDDILKAENVRKLFAILGRYCDYSNYEIILHLIKKFCEDVLKKMMLDYCKSLEQFEMTTTVDIYCRAISAGKKVSFHFREMALKIQKRTSECTLYEIRKLKEEITEESALYPHSVYIGGVAESSVLVVVHFPRDCVGWVLAAMTPAFLHRHHLTEVSMDGKRLTIQRPEGKHLVHVFQQRTEKDLNAQLRDASWEGDVVRVASLLNSGADVETVDSKHSQTPLHLASMGGHLQTVRLLLQRGAKLDSVDTKGHSAVTEAAMRSKTEVVIELVKAGATLNLRSSAENSALIDAARCGKTEVIVELAKAGVDLNQQDKDGLSALMEAGWFGKTEVVVELAKAGADLNLQNKDGRSALMHAAWWGKTEVVVELVKAGANLNLQNTKGDSAVILATVEHKSGALRELVRAGADLNLQNEEGLTALMISARSGRTELTDMLLTGEIIDTDIQENSTGWSALFFSAEAGDVDTTQLLLRAGANALLKDKNGLTALDVATAASSGQGQHEYWEGQDYDGVCKLLRRHSEGSTAPHRHHTLINMVSRSGQRIKQLFTRFKLTHQSVVASGGRDDGKKKISDYPP